LENVPVSHIVDANYENGVLKLEQPLPLKDQEKVRVTVERLDGERHSVPDIRPISLGEVLSPLTADDDLLSEMLEGRE
jgi:predicted DNA-binding antitoxin AbrB/MazE fold protein